MMPHKMLKAILIVTLLHLSVAENATDPYSVDPYEFTTASRGMMCSSQHYICSKLCSQKVNINICDSTTLQYDCKCASNNSSPGLQYYLPSIQTAMCTWNYYNCIDASVGQVYCERTFKDYCGTLDPDSFKGESVVSSPSSSSTGDSKPTSGSTTSDTASTPGPTKAAPTGSTESSPDEQAQTSSTSSSFGLSTGAKAGIGAGCAIVGLLILSAIVFYFYRARKRASIHKGEDTEDKATDDKVTKDTVIKDTVIFGPELEDTQRLEIGGREIPGELDAGAPPTSEGTGLQSVAGPVEIGMSEREELEMRRVVDKK